MIFSMYLQVGSLDRSLSFYRDGLGLEVAWNDDVVAVLRGSGETAATLVLREVRGETKPGLGQTGVTRIGWQMTTRAEFDSAEERLKRHGGSTSVPTFGMAAGSSPTTQTGSASSCS
jgi:catechol-2,3-dioxygenase